MLKLAYVTSQFPCLIKVFQQNEVLGLKANGVEITLLSCHNVANRPDLLHDFARPLLGFVHYFSPRQFIEGIGWSLRNAPAPFFKTGIRAGLAALQQPSRAAKHAMAWALAVAYAPVVHRRGCDWIHSDYIQGTATTAWHLSELVSRPFSLKCHAFDIFSSQSGLRETHAFMAKKLKAAAAVLSVHQYGARLLAAEFGPEVARKTSVVMVGVRTNEFMPLPYPQTQPPLVVALGRLEEKKGFNILIASLAILKNSGIDVHCHIYGAGSLGPALQAQINQAGVQDRVILKGPFKQADLPDIMRPAAAICMPSIKDRHGDIDGIPTVLFEAMSCARPAIASDISGIPELVHTGQTGLLTAPGDPQSVADAIRQILKNPGLAATMGQTARQYIETRHDNRIVGRQLKEIIEQFLRPAASRTTQNTGQPNAESAAA
jgi:glycosyltransferase involved in cell wall biosynthesis